VAPRHRGRRLARDHGQRAAIIPLQAQVTVDPDAASGARERLHAALEVWRDPRTYAIGAIILGMAFAEGSANDWLTIAVVDGHNESEATGAVFLTVFSVAMTVFRAVGGPLVDRIGRVWTLRALSVAAGVGLVVFILAPNLPVAFIGVALWGGRVAGLPPRHVGCGRRSSQGRGVRLRSGDHRLRRLPLRTARPRLGQPPDRHPEHPLDHRRPHRDERLGLGGREADRGVEGGRGTPLRRSLSRDAATVTCG
jgi:hypothetical protein